MNEKLKELQQELYSTSLTNLEKIIIKGPEIGYIILSALKACCVSNILNQHPSIINDDTHDIIVKGITCIKGISSLLVETIDAQVYQKIKVKADNVLKKRLEKWKTHLGDLNDSTAKVYIVFLITDIEYHYRDILESNADLPYLNIILNLITFIKDEVTSSTTLTN